MARPADKSSSESEKSTERPTTTGAAGKSETASSSPTEAQSEGARETRDSKDAQEQTASASETRSGQGGEASSAFVERLKSQHKALQSILDKRTTAAAQPLAIAKEFAAAWLPHTLVEREVLRGIARGDGGTAETIAEIEVRKDLLNLLLANLLDQGPRGAEKAALEALAEQFSALARTGQGEENALLPAVDAFLSSGRLPLQQIERRYERARQRFGRLDDDAIGEAIALLAPRRLSVHEERQQTERERDMPRYSSQNRDRDEQGRFLPEDERESGRGGGGYRSMPQRDEGGRFVSDDERRSRGRYEEDNGRSRRSSGQDYDDDRRYGSSSRERGQGGWFGDSEGHSEASRRGWENSDHGRSGWYGDREGHSEASRRGWDNPEHGRSGWFGDREGHSEASRRGWEGSEHGRSGWYGDPEGHSEAARRGWDEGHRSQRSDDDEGRYRERAARYESDERRGGGGYESQSRRGGRYEDQDDNRGSSRGHGGWSGDPEGHSEASRRGWDRRR